MFIAAFFLVAITENHPNVHQLMNKQNAVYPYNGMYHSVIKRLEVLIHAI